MGARQRAEAGMRRGRAVVAVVLVWLLVAATPGLAAERGRGEASGTLVGREVRTVHTAVFGQPRPGGVAFSEDAGLLVAGPAEGPESTVLRLGVGEELLGTLAIPGLEDAEVSSLTVDPARGELVVLVEDELLQIAAAQLRREQPRFGRSALKGSAPAEPAGATFDSDGRLLVLDARTGSIVSLETQDRGREAKPISLRQLGRGSLQGLAYNASDGLLYVLSPDDALLHAVDDQGRLRSSYDLSEVSLLDPQAMVFAPSTDNSDDPAAMNLFIVDAGDDELFGGVTEVSLAQVAAASVETVSAQLVQMIDTSKWVPASPDPSGVTYLPASDRLTVVDSEVNEVTGAGYHDVNVWEVTRQGKVERGWTTLSFTNEPTGVGHDPQTNTLFISTDSGTPGIHIVKAGADGLFGTADDERSFFNATGVSGKDVEDPEFDSATGHLFFLDGSNTDVYRIDPINGNFTDGNVNVTKFDVGRYGATDVEALALNQGSGTLLVGDRRSRQIYEVTKTGSLVRIIDARVPGMTYLSGMSMAPASNGSGGMNIWTVDRAVDNGADPKENDGKLFELTLGSTENSPPVISSVTIDQPHPRTNDTLTVTAIATDPDSDELTYEYQWRKNGGALPGETGPTLDLSVPGNGDRGDAISVRVTVSDAQAQDVRTSAQVTIVNTPPVFDQDLPDRTDAEGSTVSLDAPASDDDGDALTYAASGLPAGVSIDTSTGQISGTIAAGAAADSPYAVAVSVTDDGGPSQDEPAPPIRLVQSKAGDLSGTTTFSLTYDQPPTAGNLLIASGAHSANRTSTIPAGWDLAVDAGRSVVFYRIAGPAEPSTVTYSISGTDSFMGLSIFEYEGLHPVQSEVLDRTVFQHGSGTAVSTGLTQSTTQADELLLASVGLNGSRTFSNAWADGFVQQTVARRQTVADRVVTSMGRFQTSESWDTSVNFAVGSLVTFRASGANGAPPSAPVTTTDTFTWTVTAGDTEPTAPVVDSVGISPSQPRTNDTLTAQVSASGSGGTLTYAYQWFKNGSPLAGATSSTLDLSVAGNGDKDDQIAVRVIASAGSLDSEPVTSSAVTVVNTPPAFDQDLADRADPEGAQVSVSAEASDPDGDALTYAASGLPAGVSIDTSTGQISGTIAEGAAANSPYQVTVTVRDGPTVADADTFTWTVTAGIVPPGAPVGLAGVSTSISIDLAWEPGTGATPSGYHVSRGSSASGPFVELTAAPITTTSYRDTTAPAGQTSYYRVVAVDTGGVASQPASTSTTRSPISFRSSQSSAGHNLTSMSLPLPEGVASGDVLLTSIVVSGAVTVTPPAGWQLVRFDATTDMTMHQATYSKVAGSNEPGSSTWSFSTRTSAAAVISAYRGVDVSAPIVDARGQANPSSMAIVAPSATVSSPNSLIVGAFGIASHASITEPTDMIGQAASVLTAGPNKLAIASADQVAADASATGTRTATANRSGVNVGHLVILRPQG